MKPKKEHIDTLIRQIVDLAHPVRIVLFGSAARGDMKENSDLDVMVVMPDGTNCRETAKRLYRDIRGVRFAFDLLVATPAIIEKHAHTPGWIYHRILTEGRELYAA